MTEKELRKLIREELNKELASSKQQLNENLELLQAALDSIDIAMKAKGDTDPTLLNGAKDAIGVVVGLGAVFGLGLSDQIATWLKKNGKAAAANFEKNAGGVMEEGDSTQSILAKLMKSPIVQGAVKATNQAKQAKP